MTPIRLRNNVIFITGHGLFTVPCGISLRKDGLAVSAGGERRYIYLPTSERQPRNWINAIREAIDALSMLRENLLTRRALKMVYGEGYPGVYGEYVSPNGVKLSPRSYDPVENTIVYHKTYGEALQHRLRSEQRYIQTYQFRGVHSEPA